MLREKYSFFSLAYWVSYFAQVLLSLLFINTGKIVVCDSMPKVAIKQRGKEKKRAKIVRVTASNLANESENAAEARSINRRKRYLSAI